MLYCELYGNLYLSDWRGKWPERADGINFIPCTLWLLTATETPGTYDQQLRIVHSSFMTSRKWSNRNTSQALVSRKWVRPAASHLLLILFSFFYCQIRPKTKDLRWDELQILLLFWKFLIIILKLRELQSRARIKCLAKNEGLSTMWCMKESSWKHQRMKTEREEENLRVLT